MVNNAHVWKKLEVQQRSYLQALYEPLHGYLAIVVCILGSIFNMVNIIVLTHKDMRMNPINILLTGIAVADVMVMVEYIPFAVHMYLLQGTSRSLEEKVCSIQECYYSLEIVEL